MSASLKRKHESSVMTIFMNRLKKVADAEKKRFIGSSLDGQDTWLGADCLMSEGSRFVMAEFKYEEPDISSEKTKPRRLTMCKALIDDSTRLDEHKACHLIAWSVSDEDRAIILNCYANEVCNVQIWGTQQGLPGTPETDPRLYDDVFVKAFFRGEVGLEFAAFKAYVEWLSELDGGGSGDIELLIENPDEDTFGALQFASLSELKRWMDHNPPKSKPKPKPPSEGRHTGNGG